MKNTDLIEIFNSILIDDIENEFMRKNISKRCALETIDIILNLEEFSVEGREYWMKRKQEIENS